jgi:hypothetical protein
MRSRAVIALIVAVASLVTVALVASTQGQATDRLEDFDFAHSALTPDTARSFESFPLYWLGTKFGNLPLTRITRAFAKPQLSAVGGAAFNLPDNRTNYVSFTYGSCFQVGIEGSCAPLTVQVWLACVLSLHDYYYNTPDGRPSREFGLTSVRSAPAAKFTNGRLEIYTGRVTVSLSGDRDQVMEAAERLTSVNRRAGQILVGDPLPPPVAGAMKGELEC